MGAVWRRVAQKARKKDVTAEERKAAEEETGGKDGGKSAGGEGDGGCEAAVKRGRVRESGQAS